MLKNIKFAIKSGGFIALTGVVGIGKTTTLRNIQRDLADDGKIILSKSLATDKRSVSVNTLYTALFTDLLSKKDSKFPTQSEKRERKIQSLIKEKNKPVALFIDEAHSLHHKTLIGLKHLIEVIEDVNGTLAIIAVGHPKLANDLRNPALEEIGARTKLFELGTLGANSPKFIEWLINNYKSEKTTLDAIISKEAIEFFAERLITPLQITYYLSRAFEKGSEIGEKPISLETAKSVLSPDLNSLEARLARQGYGTLTLSEGLNVRRAEIKSYLKGQLINSRSEEITHDIRKLGILI
jgi:type II secretory pathway predicted ATPase ExeA